MGERIGARARPTTGVSTIVRSAIELAVISAERGRIVGITAASAGADNWPTEEKTRVISSRWRKSLRRPGTNAASGMSATAAARPKVYHIMICLRLTRSSITPAGGATRNVGTV